MDDATERPPVDLSGLDDATEGDVELMRELVTEFVVDGETRLELLRRGLAEDSPIALRNEAHALKGSSGVVGATRMAELAQAIERCAEKTDLSACSEGVEHLGEEFERVRAYLEERF
jgi:HPt (histidine-containing phosphotransfer) domain-containing protein